MFDQLQEIIKSDKESAKKFELIKKEHTYKKLATEAKLLRTARKQAFIMGLLTIVALIALLYADTVNTKARNNGLVLENKIEQLEATLKICKDK